MLATGAEQSHRETELLRSRSGFVQMNLPDDIKTTGSKTSNGRLDSCLYRNTKKIRIFHCMGDIQVSLKAERVAFLPFL